MNIALIGFGYTAQRHLKNIQKHATLQCIVKPSNKNTQSIPKDVPLYNHYRQTQNHNLDAVVIATPTETHFEIASFFLEKQIPVFIEKPLASNQVEATRLKTLAEKNNTILLTNHTESFDNHIAKLIQLTKHQIKQGNHIKEILIERAGADESPKYSSENNLPESEALGQNKTQSLLAQQETHQNQLLIQKNQDLEGQENQQHNKQTHILLQNQQISQDTNQQQAYDRLIHLLSPLTELINTPPTTTITYEKRFENATKLFSILNFKNKKINNQQNTTAHIKLLTYPNTNLYKRIKIIGNNFSYTYTLQNQKEKIIDHNKQPIKPANGSDPWENAFLTFLNTIQTNHYATASPSTATQTIHLANQILNQPEIDHEEFQTYFDQEDYQSFAQAVLTRTINPKLSPYLMRFLYPNDKTNPWNQHYFDFKRLAFLLTKKRELFSNTNSSLDSSTDNHKGEAEGDGSKSKMYEKELFSRFSKNGNKSNLENKDHFGLRHMQEQAYTNPSEAPPLSQENQLIPTTKKQINDLYYKHLADGNKFMRINYECNEACVFCSIKNVEKSMSYTKIKEVLDRTAKKHHQIIITGGEPTIMKGLPKIVEHATQLGFTEVNIQTNALRCADPNYAIQLVLAGHSYSLVSLHSHQEKISDGFTLTPGGFQKTLEGIRNLINLGVDINLSHVITTANYRKFPEYIEFIHNTFPEIKQIDIMLNCHRGQALDAPMLVPKLSKIYPFIKEGYQKAKALNLKVNNALTIPPCHFDFGLDDCLEMQQLLTFHQHKDIKLQGNQVLMKREKHKSPKCKQCKFDNVCYGIWKSYVSIHGDEELSPIMRGDT